MRDKLSYKEARDSGLPFNRVIYKDDWYIHDRVRNLDYSRIDLSVRTWSEEDKKANDWIVKG